jgi:hypothetical protein
MIGFHLIVVDHHQPLIMAEKNNIPQAAIAMCNYTPKDDGSGCNRGSVIDHCILAESIAC